MATKNIGYIVNLEGSAQVRTADGLIRVVNIGDPVSDRDLLITGEASSVVVGFYSGQRLQVGENAQVLLDETVYADTASYSDAEVDQIAALQQAILEGRDLDALEPTAAGNDQGGADGLHQTPVYAREGREGEVETRPTDFNVEAGTAAADFSGNDDAIALNQTQSTQPEPTTPTPPAPTAPIPTVPAGDNAPVISITSGGVIEESIAAGDVVASFSASDVDGDSLTFQLLNDPGNYFAIVGNDVVLTAAGVAAINDDTLNLSGLNVEVEVSDGSNTATAANTINITRVNDNAPNAGADSYSVDEDAVLNVSLPNDVLANDNDLDGDSLSVNTTPVSNVSNGTLVLNSDGTFNYTPDPNFNGTDSFVYEVSDGVNSAQATVTINVNAVEDAPAISGSDTANVAEDGVLGAAGALTASDADAGDLPTFGVQNVNSPLGVFTIDATGNWTYNLDNAVAQSLAAGETATETFTVTASTADGEIVNHVITVQIAGSEDAPVITGSSSAAVAEDGVQNANGALLVSDVDATDTPVFTAQTSNSPYGSFNIDAAGNWSYNLDNAAAQSLAAGETATETFTVTATTADGESVNQMVTITITGAEDVPIISGTSAGAVSEDNVLSTSGVLTVADADAADAPNFTAQTTSSPYGSFDIDASGNWTYNLDNAAAQSLAAGETATETFTVTATTGDGESVNQVVTITITGVEDAPVISGTSSGAVSEDNVQVTSGSLSVSDADAADAPVFTAQTTNSPYGAFAIDVAGNWTYNLDNAAAQSLAAGETVTETFTVTATTADGESVNQVVSITVTGAEDAPIISGTSAGSVSEDNVLTTSGTLNVTDADAADAPVFTAQTVASPYGSFAIDAAGNWSYNLDNAAAQSLAAGETVTETFTVTATTADGESVNQVVSITVTGAEDAPIISGASTGAVSEDNVLSTSGALSVADADAADAPVFTAQTVASPYGSFAIDAAGNWSYSLDNAAAQSLAAGETVTETFTVIATTADGESVSQVVSITVTGAEDAPIISGTSAGSVSEDNVLTTSGTLSVTDADAADAPVFTAQTVASPYGAFAIDAAGNWSYNLDNAAAQSLAAGETVTETFTATATTADGESVNQVVSVTVTGAEDAPVISGTSSGAVSEDNVLATSGSLNVTDADANDAPTFTAQTTNSPYGAFAIDAAGNWMYNLDNAAAQSLAAGETVTETFTVTATTADGESVNQVVSITVTGAEDAPIISGASTGAVSEDNVLSTSGALSVADADAADAPVFTAQTVASPYGSFAIDAAGNWSYNLDNAAAQSLAAGETVTETFTATATTGDGESVNQVVTITITGAEDAPVISGTSSGAVSEDNVQVTSGTLSVADADVADAPVFIAQTTSSPYGSFAIDAAGNWTYNLDNAAAQSLASGETVTETFTVTATTADGESVSQLVSVSIAGAEDAPMISGSSAGAVAEDGVAVSSGVLSVSDADANDAPTFTAQTTNSPYGSFAIDAAGNWTYNLDNAAAQQLAQGESVVETFTAMANTADGETVSQLVNITITGSNDAPVVTDAVRSIAEDSVNVELNLPLPSDVDVSDVLSITVTGLADAALGSVTLADGSAVNNGDTLTLVEFQGLQFDTVLNATGSTDFTYAVSDGISTVNGTATIDIGGTNDMPVAIGNSYTTNEDTALAGNVITDDTGAGIDSDADGDVLSVSAVNGQAAAVGSAVVLASGATLTMQADGNFAYDPATSSAYNALAVGETATDSFTYTLDDGNGGTSVATVSVQVSGANDGPIAQAHTDSAVEDGPAINGSVPAATDVDSDGVNANGYVLVSGVAEGNLIFNADGSYTFDPATDFQDLAAGQSRDVSFTYTATDAQGVISAPATVTITVSGSEDGPVISGLNAGAVAEDGVQMASGSLLASDVDAGDTPVFNAQTTSSPYGSFDIDAAGNWTYNLDNAAAQSLAAGETATETFTVIANTADGESVSQVVTINIAGAEDAPVISGTSAGAVSEDNVLTTTGSLSVSDADVVDTPVFTVQTMASPYGSFSIDAAGNWTYNLDNAAAQSLAAGETVTETFTVTATTADGESVNQVVSITVTGAEDAPVISGTSSGAVSEDNVLSTSGTLNVADADAADAPVFTAQTTNSPYGSFDIDAAGNWTYNLDNAAAQSLAAGETATETFTVTATTADGESVNQVVSITVTGAEDAPVISGTSSGAVSEDNVLATSGSLSVSDADAADVPVFTAQTTNSPYGSFDIDAAGNWTYNLDNAAAQSLAAGETVTETFTVIANTADGESVSQVVSITVTGAEDAPVISGASAGVVSEDNVLTTSGALSVNDADVADIPVFTAQTVNSPYGSFDIDASGNWSYNLDNAAAQSLAAGETVTETFTVTATTADGESANQVVAITVTGAEDAPVISGTSSGTVSEDSVLATTGTLGVTDVDAVDTPTFTAQSTNSPYGSFAIDASGNWSYNLDNAAAQSLAAGETATETFTVTATTADGESVNQVVSITVTGAEDTPIISGTSAGAVSEDNVLATSGSLSVVDADAADTPVFTAQTVASPYGSFVIDAPGNWTYSLDNAAAQSLAAGETVTETFTVSAATADGESVNQTVSIMVTGAEDAPVISGTNSGVVSEDNLLVTTGSLSVSDADAADAPVFTAQTTNSPYGSFDIDAAGDWTYNLDNAAAQSLAAGETATETFTVTATTADGESVNQVVSITITGAEDAPIISGTSSGAVSEDNVLSTSGVLSVADADAVDAPVFTAQTTASPYGSFAIDATGNWNYNLDNAAAQSLAAGETVTETFTVTASTADGESVNQVVSITITGAEDAPIISGTSSGSVSEDNVVSTSGTLSVADADAVDVPVFTAQTTASSYGAFAIDASGNWTYNLDNAAAQSLAAGETVTETFTVTATTADGESINQVVSITITGAEDAPIISGTSSGSVSEDNVVSTSGTLSVADADAVDVPVFTAQTTASSYGAFAIDASGNWTYNLDNAAAQSLAAGETATETFTVAATTVDGESVNQVVSITITGAEDAPIISGTSSGAVSEDNVLATSGTLSVTDADAVDAPTFTVQTATGTYGAFVIDASGNWSYSLDNAAAQSLAAGETATETFTVTATTADGESVNQVVSITITGAEDAPVISGTNSAIVSEDNVLSASGALSVADADAADAPVFTAQTTASPYGTFDIDAAGDWTYNLDNAAAQSLAAGETATETFTVAASTADGESVNQVVSITITGAEDAPIISGTSAGAVSEDNVLVTSGSLGVSDADAVDTPVFTTQTTNSPYGSFDIDAAGNWTYNLDNAATQSLASGEAVTETFTVTATTTDGESVNQIVTITITGAEDAPIISGTSSGAVSEDNVVSTSGTLSVADADAADAPIFTAQSTNSAYGSFGIDAAGNWTYNLDNVAAQSLAAGETVTETFTVTATTADGESVNQVVTITVTGAEDAPVVSGTSSGAVSEDNVLSTSGVLSVVDADAGDVPVFTAQTTVSPYGSFAIDAAGNWTYNLDNAAAQSLAAGEVASETFTVTATTADGESVNQVVTITITGAEDAPVISGTSAGAVSEDNVLSTSGSLSVSDADAVDAPTFTAQSTNSPYGSFAIDTAGNWIYSLDNTAAQSLAAGETASETFTVTATTADGESVNQIVTITITGAEDAPVISGTSSGAVSEDNVLSASGALSVTDADGVDAPAFVIQSTNSPYGSFDIDTAGNWTYNLDNAAAQSLAAGETATETFTVTATTADGESVNQVVTITITGAEDAPVISGTSTGAVSEDNVLTTSGTLAVTDADATDAPSFTTQSTSSPYGSFTIDTAGNWSYDLDNAAAQSLAAGETATETFTVTATTADGESVNQVVSITITGAEDAPVISGTSSGVVSEDNVLAASGSLSVADADAADTPTFTAQTTSSPYGSFDIDAAGNWTYNLDNAAAQSLAAGETATETFTVTASTADGESVNQVVTITITGAEDAPVISGASSGAVSEDNVLSTSGVLSVADADATDEPVFTAQTTNSPYGSFDIDAAGNWTYNLDNAAAQSLAAGETATETFTVTASTADGETVNQVVSITITGAEDAPIISGTSAGAVSEDNVLSTSGVLSVADADAADTPTFTAQTTNSPYGSFAIDSVGNWTYNLDNAAAQSLAAGETATETFTVTASTADGETVNQVVSITITGAEDTPIISGTSTGTVSEDNVLSTSGALNVVDADAADVPVFTAQTTASPYGSFDIDAAGNWTYNLDNAAAQSLAAGETATETFTVTATTVDGESVNQVVTITVTGAEDAPVISGTSSGAVSEDNVLATSGTLSVTDADAVDAPSFSAQTTNSPYGQFAIDTAGNWTYNLDNAAAQSLAAGETATETFTVTATTADGETVNQLVSIVIAGAEDVPVISGTSAGTVSEDNVLSTSGVLSVTDVDAVDTPTFTVQSTNSPYGSFDIDAAGNWSYNLDNASAQSLAAGETVTETFTVTATTADGESINQVVAVTVTGAEDAPIISGTSTGAVSEDNLLVTTGSLNVSDVDASDAPVFTAQTTSSPYGSFDINAAGNWTYNLDNAAAQSLAAGETATETFTVTASTADGETVNQVVSITITGAEDAPIISGTSSGAVSEDNVLATSGTLSVTDADAVDAPTFTAQTATGTYGAFVIDASGNWSYSLDNAAAQSLAAGETATETFTVTATTADGESVNQVVSITITGAEDAPIISGTSSGAVSEDNVLSASGALSVADADAADAPVFTAQTTTSPYGSFAIDAAGNWTYNLDNAAAQSLAAGETATETFTVTATTVDGESVNQVVTITVTGAEDAPVISGTSSGAVSEDNVLATSGTLSVTDADAVDAPSFSAQTTNSPYGQFAIDTAGNWTYNLDNAAAQSLAAGETATETFTVTASTADGETVNQVVSITITGAEDAPVISGTSAGAVSEDNVLSTSGTLTVSDADAVDAPVFTAQTTSSPYGSFDINAAGNWTYNLDNAAAQSLAAGETATETFTVTASTADGETVNQVVSITITGAEDTPIISGTSTGTVSEDNVLSTSGALNVVDADAADVPVFTAQTTASPYGSFDIDAAGNWTYNLDNAAVQSLAAGETATETFTVTATTVDGESVNQVVTITITGAEDAPVISGTSAGAVSEDNVLNTSGVLSVVDVDAADAPVFTAQTTASPYGAFDIDAAGNWTYNLDNAAAQSLAAGETVTETFTVTATTADGESVNQVVTITVTGAEDAPVISGSSSGTVSEDNVLTTSGTLSVADADAVDAPSFTAQTSNSAYGSFSVDTVGHWTYNLDNAAAQSLAAGQTATETFTVTATTADGESVNQAVTITISGAEDAPLISGTSTGAVSEDTVLTTSGALSVSDADAIDTPVFTAQTSNSTYGSFSVDVSGNWTYNLDNAAAQSLGAGTAVTETFTVSAATGDGETATQTVSITINGTNDLPVVSATTATTDENAVLNGNVPAATDVDGSIVTYNLATDVGAGNGSLTFNNDGSFSFDPGADFDDLAVGQSRDVSFTYTATDNNGGVSAPATVTVTVTGSNDAPVLDLDANNSSTAAGNDYITTFNEGGSAVAIADADVIIADVDTTQLQGASIVINAVQAGDFLTVGGLPAGITASAYDPVSGTLTLSGAASLADYQTAIRAIQFSNDGSATSGSRDIEVTVSDGTTSSAAATTTVNLNMLPTVSINDVSVQEPAAGTTALVFTVALDQTLAGDLTFDLDTADISALAGSDYVGISGASGTILAGDTTATITVTVNADANNFEGDETFNVNLTNFNQPVNFAAGSHLITDGVQGVGTIGANNGAPDAVDDSYITAAGTPLVIGSLLDNDELVDGASVTGFSQGTNGSVVDNGDGTYTYTPTDPGFTGTDTFTYTLTDADGETDTATVTVTVSNVVVNPPEVTAVPDTAYVENDAPVSILSGISISDVDSSNLSSVVVRIDGYIASQDSLDYLTAGTSVNASVAVSGSSWELTLTGGSSINEYRQVLTSLTYENLSDNPSAAARSITVEAYDAAYNNLYGSDMGSISITPVNDAAQVFDNNNFSVAGAQDQALNITAPTDADTDDNALVITVTGVPTSIGNVTLADGSAVNVGDTLTLAQLTSLQFDAGVADGTDVFTYSVFDGELTSNGTTTINVGSTEADTSTVYESALPSGSDAASGADIATGNLLANDAAADGSTTLDSIDFNAVNYTPDGNGMIIINTGLGTLTVYADNSNAGHVAGDYEYQLTATDGSSNDVSETFTYHFTAGAVQQDNLVINIIDDQPMAQDLVEEVPESEEQVFNIIFTLDDSGSMAWGAESGSSTLQNGEPTRMEVAKESLDALATEYFNQSTQVNISLITFNSAANFVGTYDTLADFQAALSAVTPGGGTDYVDATDEIQTQLTADIAAQNPADEVQNISYFISDGESGSSPIGSGYIEFVNANSVDSYAVGIGSSLPSDLSDLNYIHNIDSMGQGNGHVDEALIVADVSQLEAELLSTVPTAFGGNIVANGSIQNLSFGADGGYVQSIDIDLGSPASTYTFSYDGNNITVLPALATLDVSGSQLILNADDGFQYGTFTFDFADGSYLFIAPNGTAGSTFNFDYTIIDGDNDTATATATVNIVDDQPDARDDLHSVDPYETAAGNVVTAIGTDGGPSYGGDFTPFATQGGGVDKVVDDAAVSEFGYRGVIFDLTGTLNAAYPDPTGSGENNVEVDSNWNPASSDFTISGTYNGNPATLNFYYNGVGVSGSGASDRLNNGEALTVTFDAGALPYGVENLTLTMTDFGNSDSVDVDVYDINDTLLTSFTENNSSTIDLSAYTGIGSVTLTHAGGYDSALRYVDYDPTPAPPPSFSLPADGSDGTLSWTYSGETDIDGNLVVQATVTDSADGSTFVMRSNGYYNFTPDQTGAPVDVSVDTTSQANVNASDLNVSIRSGGSTLDYSSDGVGVVGGLGQLLSSGEALLVSFDNGVAPNGIDNLVLTLNDFQQVNTDQATVIVTHDTDGDGVYTTDTVVFSAADNNNSEVLDLSQFSSVTQFDIEYTGGGYDFGLRNVSYQVPATGTLSGAPELIEYTLTDTDGQSDTAQLSIYTIDRTISGTVGADNIIGGAENDAIIGDSGDDTLSGGAGHDTLSGGAGLDTLFGNTGDDALSGGDNDDSLFGGAGRDHLSGDAGDDLLDGGTGDDRLLGGDGADQIYGGADNDHLEGGAGYDSLFGGAGDDTLFGGSDVDILNGGSGNDVLTGGDDVDTFVWHSGDEGSVGSPASDVITDFTLGSGGDVLNLADMLQGENTGNLTDYLHFSGDGNGGTVISIDVDGGGVFESAQEITLSGVDLTGGGSLTDQQILDSLLSNGNLVVD